MYKIVDTFTNKTSVFLEEYYFDDSRIHNGYTDTFTGVSRLREFPVPAWGDVKQTEEEVLIMFIKNNRHTSSIGFVLNEADYARLKEVKYTV